MVNRADIELSSANESTAHCEQLYVVGIGASAGGLDALRTLFNQMPPQPGIACVVVVHLSPEHDSQLAELLQQYTPMRVQQVTETVALERNRVYVIPPNANLDSIDTHLRLSQLEKRRIERAPIDHFFHTLGFDSSWRGDWRRLDGRALRRRAGAAADLGERWTHDRPGPRRSAVRQHAPQRDRHRERGHHRAAP